MDKPEKRMSVLFDMFQSQKRDPRYDVANADGSVVTTEEKWVDVDEEEVESSIVKEGGMTPDLLSSFIKDLKDAELESDENADDIQNVVIDGDKNSTSQIDRGGKLVGDQTVIKSIENFFLDGDSSKMFLEFKAMLGSDNLDLIGRSCRKLMQFMQLGKCEKGSISMEGKFKSLQMRSFAIKTAKRSNDSTVRGGNSNCRQIIKRDTLVTYRVKRGKTESLEYYRVLAIFSKHYNKWFLHWDDEVLFEKGSTKFKILARMVVKDGNRIKEVDLEKDGQ